MPELLHSFAFLIDVIAAVIVVFMVKSIFEWFM